MKALFAKNGGLLVPFDDDAKEQVLRLKDGQVVTVSYTRVRNIKFHNKFFAMLDVFFDNQSDFVDKKQFRKAAIVEAGFYDEVRRFNGDVVREAQSISFTKMKDDDKFNDVYNAVLNSCLRFFGEHLDQETLERVVRF